MKKIIYAMVLLISLPSFSQDKSEIDTAAVKILDRMSGMIGDLSSIKFKAHVAKDVKENQFGLVKEYSQNEVYMVGPDKMHVESIGNHGHRGYWYNGET